MPSSIRYTNRDKVPTERHYKVSRFPLATTIYSFKEGVKYQTVLRVDGKAYNPEKKRWKNDSRFVTVSHTKLMKRKELEKEARKLVTKTSEHFRIRKVVIIEARKSPVGI